VSRLRLRDHDLGVALVSRLIGIARLLGDVIGIVISGGIGYILVCVRVLFLSVRARIGHVPLSFRLGFRHIMLDFGLSLRLVASGQRGCCGDERAECFEMHR
jgi:uncharacterized membrane protein YedE/YeeE